MEISAVVATLIFIAIISQIAMANLGFNGTGKAYAQEGAQITQETGPNSHANRPAPASTLLKAGESKDYVLSDSDKRVYATKELESSTTSSFSARETSSSQSLT